MRPGSFLLFFRVLYVRSLQTVHASAITGRFSAFATWFSFLRRRPHLRLVGGHAELGLGHRGTSGFYARRAGSVNGRGAESDRREPPSPSSGIAGAVSQLNPLSRKDRRGPLSVDQAQDQPGVPSSLDSGTTGAT
jgi:hypothetical protein